MQTLTNNAQESDLTGVVKRIQNQARKPGLIFLYKTSLKGFGNKVEPQGRKKIVTVSKGASVGLGVPIQTNNCGYEVIFNGAKFVPSDDQDYSFDFPKSSTPLRLTPHIVAYKSGLGF